MSEYANVKVGKLRLKGEKLSKHKKHKHKKKDKHSAAPEVDSDAIAHGGWWSITNFGEIIGSVAIEFQPFCYVKALDTGLFVLGGPHAEGEGPDPEEVLTAVPVSDTKIALKSGYGKYLRVAGNGSVTGRSDAIGSMEQWEPVFQDGKLAILGCTNCFMSADENGDIVSTSRTAGENEVLKIRSVAERQKNDNDDIPEEEKGSVSACEVNYVRSKMKSDKFCK